MKSLSIYAAGFIILLFSACGSYQKVPYFQDLSDTTEVKTLVANDAELLRLESGDKLNIVVSSALTPEVAAQYNLPLQSSRIGAVGGNVNGNAQTTSPFYVDAKGNIDFPVLGKVRVAGLTREELEAQLQTTLKNRKLLNDAVVTVEVLNHFVNVLGEVNRPGRVPIAKDNMTLLEAIAYSGDLTITGERNNVLVMRKEGNKRRAYRVDLTQAQNVYASPAYQLKQDDVIYVRPNEKRQRQSTPVDNVWQSPSTYLSITSVMVSVAVLISNLLKK